MRTYTFQYSTREVPILLDVHLPDASSQGRLPIFVWWHGGGLIQGSRQSIAPHLRRAVDKYGIAVISTDYRLAPQVRVADIQQDMDDCLAYVHERLAADLGKAGEEAKLDTDRIVLSGSSAGGWQSLMLGLGMCPQTKPEYFEKLKGIAAIYPITTMDHPFFLEKQTPFGGKINDDPELFKEYRDSRTPVVSNTSTIAQRNRFYVHAQQDALFPSLLFSDEQRAQGWLQKTDVARFVRDSSSEQRKCFPPVYMIHGDMDTAVDVDQARIVNQALKEVGASVVYDEVPGKEHLWDQHEPDEDLAPLWNFAMQRLQA
ncbi:alpha/beta-hydrolase [Testicularia cyperi]|uniref:Alpha/beta-hydrolase n=1 Tax=Testicularia cyperi TaxID=1882483 RepID=A0A317XHU1_9BASI|nr:alpha/beta-hydrolase [Testicularia cyperi]